MEFKNNNEIISLEQSIEDCNEHYRGMLDVYSKAIRSLRENKFIIKGAYTQDSPFEKGRVDGNKKVDRIMEEVNTGSLTIEEAVEYLENESKKIESLIQFRP